MSGSRKRDFSLFYDDEFEVEKTNDWDCDCLDLEDDGLDGIFSQSLEPLQNYERKQIWFSSVPIGHNKLQGMVKCIIMEKAGVNGHFTNHSLRATAVSRLFREGVDDKLIKGVTGHRSEALDCYKRETEEQHANVSKIVQGITSEKGATAESSAPIEKGDDGMGSVVLNISGGNCNITIVNKR